MVGANFLSILRSLEYNQELWIFGERHKIYEAKNCKLTPDINIVEYLTILLSKRFHDVFVETTYHRGKTQSYHELERPSQIKIVLDLLSHCYPGYDCPFKIRLHHADIRTKISSDYYFDIFIPIKDKLYDYYIDDIPIESCVIPQLESFIEETQKHFTIDAIQQFFGIKPPSKIEIEIRRIDIKFASETDKLLLLYNNIVIDLLATVGYATKMVNNANRFILNQNTNTLRDLYRSLRVFWDEYFDNEAKLLDVYTLARMFHHFQNPKVNQTSTVDHGIFFGGSRHSKNIVDHLKNSGYIEIFTSEDDSGCISVPNYTPR